MALKYSQGAVEAMMAQNGTKAESGTGFALVDGGAGADTITRSTGDFTTTFRAGDTIRVIGATDPSDDVETVIVSVAALTITLATGIFTTGQASGSFLAIVSPVGSNVPEIFNGGTLNFYSGTRPSDANDDIGTATELASFEDVVFGAEAWDSVNVKAYSETSYSGSAIAAGTGTWWRLTALGDNETGSSTTAKRIDGTLGTGAGDINLPSVAFSLNDPIVGTLRFRLGKAR